MAYNRATMKVVIRYPKRREVSVRGPKKLHDVFQELDLNPETMIAVRGKMLLTRDTVLSEDDSIEVISAISGGL